MKRFLAMILTLLIFFFASDRARADEGPKSEAAPLVAAERPIQLHVDLGLGSSMFPGTDAFGGHVGAIALFRAGFFELGPVAHYNLVMTDSRAGGGFTAGIGAHGASRIGFDALGEVGLNACHVGGGLFSGRDPGVTREIPYAGMRIGANVSLGSRASHLRTTLGLWVYGQHDLAQRDVTYTYMKSGGGLFSDDNSPPQATTVTRSVGGLTELGFRLAVGFDITPSS